MSPSVLGMEVRETEDFAGEGRLGKQMSMWVESAGLWNSVGGGEDVEEKVNNNKTRQCKVGRSEAVAVNTVPNDVAAANSKLLLGYKLMQEIRSLQNVESMCGVDGGECAVMTDSEVVMRGGECLNSPKDHRKCVSPQDTPASINVKTFDTQGSDADVNNIESRQNQKKPLTPPLQTSLSAGHVKDHAGKTLSERLSLNFAFGFFGNTSGGRPSLPSAPPAAATPKPPPRPWEVKVLLFAFLLIASVNGRYDRGGQQHTITWGRGNTHNSAVFGNRPTNVTAVLGHRASLPCQVKNLGHKDVSWIRQRDLHILTVGIFTYTSDDRFKVFHPPETENWFLEISSVTFRDSGVYECQVSTSPKVSLPITLTVLAVQQAEIPGPHEVFIQHGSTISLQCEVRAGVEAVGVVRWYHGDKPLNYSSTRGGISMEVEKTPTMTTSKLYITRAVKADIGNYTCAPKFSRPDSVFVHVVNAGEESAAAVQSGVMSVRACVGVVSLCFIVALTALTPDHLLLILPLPSPRRL